MVGLDAAMKAADVQMGVFMDHLLKRNGALLIEVVNLHVKLLAVRLNKSFKISLTIR